MKVRMDKVYCQVPSLGLLPHRRNQIDVLQLVVAKFTLAATHHLLHSYMPTNCLCSHFFLKLKLDWWICNARLFFSLPLWIYLFLFWFFPPFFSFGLCAEETHRQQTQDSKALRSLRSLRLFVCRSVTALRSAVSWVTGTSSQGQKKKLWSPSISETWRENKTVIVLIEMVLFMVLMFPKKEFLFLVKKILP